MLGIPAAVWVMIVVMLIALATVVAVMYFGTQEDAETSTETERESAAAKAWQGVAVRRQEERQQALDTANVDAAAAKAATSDDVTDAPKGIADVETATSESKTSDGESTGKTVGDLSDDERERKRQEALERRRKRAAMQAAQDESES